MQAGLLVDGGEDGRLGRLGGNERAGEVELESLCDLVLRLDLSTEDIAGSPGLRELSEPQHL